MFEIKIALKYLLFKKRRFSSSIISLISIFIISLVVWLILIFLSVTDGIEKNWLNKLTSLNAPIRVSLSDEYYTSYYYLIDSISSFSDYSAKTIKEKFLADKSDPYDISVDRELPINFPRPLYNNEEYVDPIKNIFSILENLKKNNKIVS